MSVIAYNFAASVFAASQQQPSITAVATRKRGVSLSLSSNGDYELLCLLRRKEMLKMKG